ncbi:hypothetical protein MYX75_07245 [Acidobacteria bacterium AH-259-A15]|nr:hypothetical protein [Acidobacteria bacterium AH-259-A15]
MRKTMVAVMSIVLLVGTGFTTLVTASPQRRGSQGPRFGGLGTDGPRTRDPLVILKRALSDAGAPALTAEQEGQLTSLIQDFRQARQPQGPNSSLQTARRAYEDAILAGDFAAAQAQAAIIADQTASSINASLQAQAEFKIQLLTMLNADQVSFLSERVGTKGLSTLLNSLARPRGFFPRLGGSERFGSTGEPSGPGEP